MFTWKNPKEVFVHKDILEFGVYDAVMHFNIGCSAIIEIFKSMNIPADEYTELACQHEDKSRVLLAHYKSTPQAKRDARSSEDTKRKMGSLFNYAETCNFSLTPSQCVTSSPRRRLEHLGASNIFNSFLVFIANIIFL